MANKAIINSAHGPGNTCIAISADGLRAYTGGADSLVRIWKMDLGADQEPDAAMDAEEGISTLATADDCWLSGSEDGEVRRYRKETSEFEGLITRSPGVPIRCIAIDPKGKKIAVTSDELTIKVIDLDDTSKISILTGHTSGVRKATWHPSGSLLTTCGSDGRIIAWDVSNDEPKQERVIDGIIPAVSNTDSPELLNDCSAVWHPSGQYFVIASRAHEIVNISRNTWSKSSTFSDEALSGAISSLAISSNGVYLASASKFGVGIWSTQTRRLLFRHSRTPDATVTQLSFSPTRNLLAWVDSEGVLSRWQDPIPASSPDPVKLLHTSSSTTKAVERKRTPMLFGEEDDLIDTTFGNAIEHNTDDFGDDDWIIDDLGGGMIDEPDYKARGGKDGFVKEMVSVTKAQPAFQTSSTPMENKRRYLAYNNIGVIEVTDQDTHHIVNVEFHDRSTRKGYHFSDYFKYNIASLGERGAAFACQPENDHPAHVMYKPYGNWTSQGEWTYELPKDTTVLGITAGGTIPGKSLRASLDGDLEGNGNVVIATSDNQLTFLSGSGIERYTMGLDGDFVSMIAGPEWVFVVHREGATTMDGSQNLRCTLVDFKDFCFLQSNRLPIRKGHFLKWIGVTEEGAPTIYDSSGMVYILPRFRIPLRATWACALNTTTLARREGKDESYWPVGVSGTSFLCLILKGKQEHPGFPRPIIQELEMRMPFHGTDAKQTQLEEHLARESILLNILRDGLGDTLTTEELSKRELALDKELIQMIQYACKSDKLPRALDLAKLLHHTATFDMAIKVAGFYHLIGLQEKLEVLKDSRERDDRLTSARDKRKGWTQDSKPIPAPAPRGEMSAGRKAFQDFGPPPIIHRPGLAPAVPLDDTFNHTSTFGGSTVRSSVSPTRTGVEDYSFGDGFIDAENILTSAEGKRKRGKDDENMKDLESSHDGDAKKQAIGEDTPTRFAPKQKANPFARKLALNNNNNPFTRNSEFNKSLQKSESFFDRVDAAENEHGKGKRSKNAGKEKKATGQQTTLFGLPVGPPPEKKARKGKKVIDAEDKNDDADAAMQSQIVDETKLNDVTMVETTETQQPTQVETQLETSEFTMATDSPEDGQIEWPPSPAANADGIAVDVSA